MTTWYDILQVSQKASTEVIEMAYKALAKKCHPDLHTNESRKQAEEKMKILNQAREILTSPDSRKQYDIFLSFQQQIERSKPADTSDQINKKTSENSMLDKYKSKFVLFIDKWPHWLRWIMAIPVFICLYYLCYMVCYLFYHNTFGYIDKNNIVWNIISQPISIGFSLYILSLFLPRFKFISLIIISCVFGVILTNPIYSWIIDSIQYNFSSLLQYILSAILTIPILIYLCVQSFRLEFRDAL